MVDYVRIAAKAKKLIEENGRNVTLIKKSRTAADAAKPWRGPSGTGDVALGTVKAVIYPATEKLDDGTLVYRGFEIAMLAHDSLPTPVDLSVLDSIKDGTDTYKITKASKIGPGDLTITYEFHLKR